MPRPRSQLISLSDTPFYHCVSRCVRRAYLCGEDELSGQNYEHRRGWLEQLLLFACEAFAIKLCSYAIMSNHYHVVLHVRPDLALSWSDYDVVERWHRLYAGTPVSSRFLANQTLSNEEKLALNPLISLWRERLTNISWLMRVVNERIARRANAEDDCTGSFWEGRFKSQALLDDQALLSCMAYVDLNPIRANQATGLKQSDYTSVKRRIAAVMGTKDLPSCIESFVGNQADRMGIPYGLKDYLDLVQWSGKIIRPDKSGYIPEAAPNLLEELNIDAQGWSLLTTQFELRFRSWVGAEQITKSIYNRSRRPTWPRKRNPITLSI